MKKISLLFSALLLVCTMAAQPHGTHNKNPRGTFPPPPQGPSILVQSQNHETFQVYIDGDLVNNIPNSEVLINNLDTRLHEVIVVLTHPAHKAAATQLYAGIPSPIVTVSYDMRRQQMLLYTSQTGGNYPDYGHNPHHNGNHRHGHGTTPIPPSINPSVVEEPATVTDQWVDEMTAIIKRQSFDSEKLTAAKGLLNNGLPLTAAQIARIAQTLDFGSSQVDFLKAAYSHCYDPQNYERALTVLTFSSDRETVRNYISTLR